MFQPSTTRPPVIYDAPPFDYHGYKRKHERGDPQFTMSRGELRKFSACPRKWRIGIPDAKGAALDWGSLVDCAYLTPQHFETVYAIAPETYTAAGKKKDDPPVEKPWNWNATVCGEWRDEQEAAGKVVVKSSTASDAWKAVERLREDPEIESIRAASKTQVVVNVDWHDEATGLVIPFRALLDLVPDPASDHGDTLYDLKTTDDASGQKWARHVYNFGLYYQAAVYLMALNAAAGLKYRNFGHIIQESDSPYEPTHRVLTEEFLQLGRIDFTNDMQKYCRCLKGNFFPGYDNDPCDVSPWMIMNP